MELVVLGVLARGHVLLEGLPGLGKTELVKGLSRALALSNKRVQFTPTGLQWLAAFEAAVRQAQRELEQDIGEQVAQVLALGLEAYARGYENPA